MNLPKKIKAKCHKVLPLVYDESLSYYEVICKLIAKINELIDEIERLKNGGDDNG